MFGDEEACVTAALRLRESFEEKGMADYSRMSDRELLENNSEDSEKISELISRYMKTVLSAASKYSALGDRDELVSDGMQALLAAIRSYDGEKGEFSVYFHTCLDNKLRNSVKNTQRRKSRLAEAEEGELEGIADTRPTPEEQFIERESSEALLKNMRAALTALEFRCIEGVAVGLSYEEISKRLGVDKKSVDNAVSRARAKLRKFYSDK